MKSAMAVPVLLSLVTGDAQAQGPDLKPYANARYGFTILVPRSYRPGPLPANGDGRTFTSPDGTVTVNGSGHLLEKRGDVANDFQRELGFETEDGFRPTYSARTATGYTYSGLHGNRIVYVRALPSCGGNAVVSVTITYPTSDKAAMDRAVVAIAKSLRGTSGCS